MRRVCQQGAALAIMAVLTALLSGWIVQASRSGIQHKQMLLNEDAQNLAQIKEHLLAASMLRGQNSHSDPGSLPCPALSQSGPPPARCDKSTVGYLPVESHHAQGYINLTIPSSNSRKAYRQQNSWAYAVSEQVVQPNVMGWSQGVDWQKPSLQILIDGHLHTELATVVAESISQSNPQGVFAVGGKYLLITGEEVKKTNLLNQQHLMRQLLGGLPPEIHLASDFHVEPAPANDAPKTTNSATLDSSAGSASRLKTRATGCECRCTKTRCTCGCSSIHSDTSNSDGHVSQALWQSEFECHGTGEGCSETEGGLTLCTSQPDKPCEFKGAAGLQSGWPVTRMRPLPVASSACQWADAPICSPSTSSTACICEFDWPRPLQNFEFLP